MRYAITVTDEGHKDMDGVAKELSDLGCAVDRILPLVGCFYVIYDGAVRDLNKIKGVKEVEVSGKGTNLNKTKEVENVEVSGKTKSK